MSRFPLLLSLPLLAALCWFFSSSGSPAPSAEPKRDVPAATSPATSSAKPAPATTAPAAAPAPAPQPIPSWDPDVERAGLHVAPGYEINLFASEREFPDLVKPIGITFDARNRLWVSTMPSYPQYVPGTPPDDKLLILEDSKGAGRADKCTVFADKLYLPIGFELGDGGAYVSQMPDLMFLRDSHGGDKADERRVILHGFGTEDSHHAMHMFTWGPDGGLYFQEGTFFHSQIETPYGPVRLQDSGIYRFVPRRSWLEVFVSYNFANPWGHVFDRWGQDFIADASGGSNYFAAPITGHVDFPYKHPEMKVFTSIVRPTCGCELVSSRQFPDSAQGNFLVNNNIAFQGIKQHRVIEEGSGFTSKEIEPLLFSSDPNFRPVAIKFGPDGALYVADWFNPIIGHMQYSLRDPGRDHGHGRIWRITYKGRPLLTPPKIAGQPIPALLDLLKSYEDRTRYVVRRELRDRPAGDVAAALKTWIAGLDAKDANYQHDLLEALWTYQTIDVYEPALLKQLLRSADYHVRAGATRVLRYWLDRVDKPLSLLRVQADDENPRVRLEAVLACSFIPKAGAADVALDALKQPTDYYIDYALKETIHTLQPYWQPYVLSGGSLATDNPVGMKYILHALGETELAGLLRRLSSPPSEESRLHGMIRKAFPSGKDIWLRIVCEETLDRGGMDRQLRIEAIKQLALIDGREPLDVLLEIAPIASRVSGDSAVSYQPELADLLADWPVAELASKRETLVSLIKRSSAIPRFRIWRQAALAALVVVDHSSDAAWEMSKDDTERLADLVAAVPKIADPKLRESMYPRLHSLLHKLPEPLATRLSMFERDMRPIVMTELRPVVIAAIVQIPGHEAETFSALTELIHSGTDAPQAIEALRQIPREKWPAAEAGPLAGAVVNYATSVPVAQRSAPSFTAALQFARDLAAPLPEKDRKKIQSQIDDMTVPTILIRSVHDMIKFDRPRFYVQAGRPVEIVFENTDIMPHNLVIARPGSLEEIGVAAEKMSARPDATARNFLPESSKVIAATKLVQSTQSEKLLFVAPDEPGDYPFLCTFPGHWRRMNGVMEVVPDLKKALRERPLPDPIPQPKARPFVKNWKMDEIAPLLQYIRRGCSLENGKALFTAASCIKCHKIRGEGGVVGPDLTDVSKRLKLPEILREVMVPSAVIAKGYETYIIETKSGRVLTGRILKQTDKSLQVAVNPLETCEPVNVPLDDIESKRMSAISLMPEGLLVTLSKGDIIDLLAYVHAGGDPNDAAFQPD